MKEKIFHSWPQKVSVLLVILFLSSCFTVCAENKNKENRQKVVDLACKLEGKPYKYGAYGPSSFDCSGFVFYVFRTAIAKQLPRTASAIHTFANPIKQSELEKGDLVFFKTTSSGRISHVGIYIGNNKFISAISDGSETGVIIRKLSDRYWKNAYYSSGRVLPSVKMDEEEETEDENEEVLIEKSDDDNVDDDGIKKKSSTNQKSDSFFSYLMDGCTCYNECRPCSLLW